MGAAAIAAMAAKRKRDEEEQQMTPYSSQDLQDSWEFKIVRSATGAFRKPEEFRKLLDREARSGWVMLEKFDADRVRFKRPTSARAQDASLPAGVDPYSTEFGISQSAYEWILAGSVIGGCVLFFGALALIFST